MPWKECQVMDERLRFVGPPARRREDGASVRRVRHFAEDRVQDLRAVQRLRDRSVHRSQSAAVSAGESAVGTDRGDDRPVEAGVSGLGGAEDREKLRQQVPGLQLPAISTVHAVLHRHGPVKHRRRRRPPAAGAELSRAGEPNALWCADYKGEFMLGNRRDCYPLTITDLASRYLLTCEALFTTQGKFAVTVFAETFQAFGLPGAVRT